MLGRLAAVLLSRKLVGAGRLLELPEVPFAPCTPEGPGGAGRAARVSESALSAEVLPSLPPFPAQAAPPSACFLDDAMVVSGGGKVGRVLKGEGGATDSKPWGL